jgi:hypothetical protein
MNQIAAKIDMHAEAPPALGSDQTSFSIANARVVSTSR